MYVCVWGQVYIVEFVGDFPRNEGRKARGRWGELWLPTKAEKQVQFEMKEIPFVENLVCQILFLYLVIVDLYFPPKTGRVFRMSQA